MVDRIFTRIGASDDLSKGDSTFMVEMREASTIIRKATSCSLVLIDEIGRGTATRDGLALALAISEWLHDSIKCRTLFATHFHELTGLIGAKEGSFCLAVGVIEKQGEIIFTHRIENKIATKSFGLEVAKLAGLPDALIQRAQMFLMEYQSETSDLAKTVCSSNYQQADANALADNLIDKIRSYNPNSITPFEALGELIELKKLVEGEIK
jgi:DNA mismatch repair protein MutS